MSKYKKVKFTRESKQNKFLLMKAEDGYIIIQRARYVIMKMCVVLVA